MNLLAALEKWPKLLSLFVGIVLTAAIGILDYLTGYELTFSAFYLLPIFVLTWCLGRGAGIGGAVASAALRTWADLAGGQAYSSPLYVYWNAGMRLALFVAFALVLSALRLLVAQQRSLASTDHLTGAANSRAFREALQSEIERSRRYGHRFALAYIDLDNFKSVNDSLGHAAGDAVLRGFVSAVRAHVRHTDTIGRLGGDEFVLLLPETDHAQAVAAVAKMRAGMLKVMKEKGWDVTMSVGVFTAAEPAMDAEAIIHSADELMYAAKVSGKNEVRWSPAPPSKTA